MSHGRENKPAYMLHGEGFYDQTWGVLWKDQSVCLMLALII